MKNVLKLSSFVYLLVSVISTTSFGDPNCSEQVATGHYACNGANCVGALEECNNELIRLKTAGCSSHSREGQACYVGAIGDSGKCGAPRPGNINGCNISNGSTGRYVFGYFYCLADCVAVPKPTGVPKPSSVDALVQ